MTDFGAWGPVELKISLGEILNAIAIALTGYWVAHVIESRKANQRANKDLVVVLCRECLDNLTLISEIVESDCLPGKEVVSDSRNKITRGLQRFSNSIYAIERACKGAGLEAVVREPLEALKSHRESLRTQITDPLALGSGLDAANVRQIEGTITQARESIIDLEISVNKR